MAGSKKKGKGKIPVEEMERLNVEATKAADAERRRQERDANLKKVEEEQIVSAEKRLGEAEAARLTFEKQIDENYLKSRLMSIANINRATAKQEDWDKWVACIALPNVDIISSLNDYLSMFQADATDDLIDEPAELTIPTLDKCYMNEQVITLLSAVSGKAHEIGDSAKVAWCNEYQCKLRDLTSKELDKLTVSYLHRADDYHDENSAHEVVSVSAACPRKIEIELQSPFDYLPDLQPPPKAKKEGDEGDAAEDKKEEDVAPVETMMFPKALPSEDVPEMYFGVWVHTSSREREKKVLFDNIEFRITKLPLALQQTRTCIRVLMTSYDHISHIPEKKKRERREREERDRKERERLGEKKKKKRKGQRYVSVGGIINIEQLAVPLPPKMAKTWVVREHSSLTEDISVQPYPTKVEGASASSDPTPPLEITYKIPKFVLLKDGSPRFGWWNARTELWEEEGVEGTGFDPETRLASLKLSTLRPFAVIQPRALDFPFRTWSLRPLGSDSVLLSVTGSRFEVQLEITDGKVKLVKPEHETLAPIFNKLMDPGVLLMRLARAGINLIPSDEDAEFCRKPKKNALEPMLHEQLSTVAPVFEFTASNWNSARGGEKALFKLKLCPTPAIALPEATAESTFVPDQPPVEEPEVKEEEPQEDEDEVEDSNSDYEDEEQDNKEPEFPEWLQVMCTTEKFWVSQSTDSDFSEKIMEGQESHTTLRRALAAYFNQRVVLDRTGLDVKAVFAPCDRKTLPLQQTINRTLNLLRIFTFC